MKKKISVLIYSLGAGGAERVVSTLLSELKDRFEFTLVLMNDTIFYDVPKNTEIVFLEKSQADESNFLKLLKLPFLAWKYKRFCKKESIDISLSFMNRPNYINIFSKMLGNDAKTVINERAMPSLQYGYKNLQSKINIFLIRALYAKADYIVSNSLGNAADLKDNFGIKKKIDTVYNPCDIEKINELKNEKADFDFKKFTYISVGRLDRGKNHKMLIEAFSKVNGESAQLLIIGEGELKNELQKQIELLNIKERVFLLGHQINPYKWMAKSDCFVFSSNHEGFPNVLLEALACGLCVISTDCQSGPREILAPESDFSYQEKRKIEHAKFGLMVPVEDKQKLAEAMSETLRNRDLTNQYKKDAIIRAKNFNKNVFINRFIKVLTDVTKSGE